MFFSMLPMTPRHDSPVAFVASIATDAGHSSPRVIRLQTRSLTPFETRSLDRLRAGSEVVTETRGPDRLVVGAVRARKDCLSCHAGYKESDVLGALTYRLSIVEQ